MKNRNLQYLTNNKVRYGYIFQLFLFLLLFSSLGIVEGSLLFAQDIASFYEQFATSSAQTETQSTSIVAHALSLFWILVGLELAFAGIRLLLNGADLQAFVGTLVKQVLFIGFFFLLLTQGPQYGSLIIQSFTQISDESAVGKSVSPDEILNLGISLSKRIMGNYSYFDSTQSFSLVIITNIILVAFSAVAAFYLLILAEIYICLIGSLIVLGLGGNRFTKFYAIRYYQYAFSVGLKLLIFLMILRLAFPFFLSLNFNIVKDTDTLLSLLGYSIAFSMISIIAPSRIQSVFKSVPLGSWRSNEVKNSESEYRSQAPMTSPAPSSNNPVAAAFSASDSGPSTSPAPVASGPAMGGGAPSSDRGPVTLASPTASSPQGSSPSTSSPSLGGGMTSSTSSTSSKRSKLPKSQGGAAAQKGGELQSKKPRSYQDAFMGEDQKADTSKNSQSESSKSSE